MALVGVLDVASRNELPVFPASRPGQYKAHCPVCGDRHRTFHLYLNEDRDVFFCQKCGAHGGSIAFHAWLRGTSFEEAKADLYPPAEHPQAFKRPVHPAERLTKAQLSEIGFRLRTPKRTCPSGVDPSVWRAHQKAELDWIWSEWVRHESIERQLERKIRAQLEAVDRVSEPGA